MPVVGTTKRGLTPRDGLWLSIAVLLHAGLFLVPVGKDSLDRRSAGPALLIELRNETPVERPFVEKEPPTVPEPVQPQEPPEPQEPDPLPEPPLKPVMEVAAEEPETVPEPENPLSTAVLLQSAADRKWPVPKEESDRQLGVFVPQDLPPNWKPALTLDENLFDGMTVPRRVEVVDRWLSPDGSYNVVVNTPGGDTMCGRGRAWDPMQPLIEHVVQFASCGGGGKRTFEWPGRYRNRSNDGVMANSTTN